MGDGVADAQPRQRIGLAEGAGDDQVRIHRLQGQRRRPFRRVDEFGVGLVDDHHDVRGNARHERGERIGRVPGASGIVGIGQIDQTRRIRDRGGDGVEIVAARHHVMVGVARRSPQRGARGLRGDGVDREPELRRHHIDARPGEHLRELHQQFVRAVAEQDRGGVDAVLRCERALEIGAERIGIAEAVVDHAEHGFLRLRAGAVGIFVRSKLDEMRVLEPAPERDQIVAGIVGAQALDAGLGECGEEGFVGHEKSTISNVATTIATRAGSRHSPG